jgi:protease-4
MKKLLLLLAGFFLVLIAVSALVTLALRDGVSLGDKVALVRVEGPILDARSTVKALKEHAGDPSVKAIVLRVDSPGGAVAPSQEIYAEVLRAKERKRVIASMGAVAASGGYYVSAPADRIMANPGTITGSIGVIMELPNVEGLMRKVGISTRVIKSGRHKDTGSPFRELDEEERQLLQGVIDDVYEQFIEDVSVSRGMPLDDVRRLADGRILTGRQALGLGLVDELGGLEDAIRISAELAGISGEPHVVGGEKRRSLLDLLSGSIENEMARAFPRFSIQYLLSP